MVRQWREVFDKHKESPPNWKEFEKYYGAFEEGNHNAPTDVPDGGALHARAQKAKEGVSGRSDGWLPKELKALPLPAWQHRAEMLKLAVHKGTFPEADRAVNMTASGKSEESSEPLDHRLISLFSCL